MRIYEETRYQTIENQDTRGRVTRKSLVTHGSVIIIWDREQNKFLFNRYWKYENVFDLVEWIEQECTRSFFNNFEGSYNSKEELTMYIQSKIDEDWRVKLLPINKTFYNI